MDASQKPINIFAQIILQIVLALSKQSACLFFTKVYKKKDGIFFPPPKECGRMMKRRKTWKSTSKPHNQLKARK